MIVQFFTNSRHMPSYISNRLHAIQRSTRHIRLLIPFALSCAAAFAGPPNSITILDTSGSAQTARPLTIGRFFAKGEIPNYPMPSVAGTGLSAWQADVKTRWRDGTATCTVTGASNANPIVISCAAPHGYREGEQVTVTGIPGNTAANGTWWISPVSSTAFSLHGAVGNGTYSAGGTATGPADGSAQHAIISFRANLAARSTVQVSFVNSTNPSSAGTAAQTLTAAVTKAQLQSWDIGSGPGNWGAAINLINGTTKTVDAKAILSACTSISTDFTGLSCRYWLAGPVVSQVIVEDRTPARAFDTGFHPGNPIHPWFIITAYAGWQGLKVDYVLENTWTGNALSQGMQLTDDAYQVVINKGYPLASWYTYPSSGTFNHWASTRYRETAWQGTTPGTVWIDYNMPYVTYTGLTYNYDSSFSLPSSYWDPNNGSSYSGTGGFSEVYMYNQSDGGHAPNTMGSITTRLYGDPGAHAEYGLDDRFDVAWMYSWNAGLTDPNARLMENVIAGDSEVLGHVNIHFRENLTGRTFCNSTNNCVAAGVGSADAYGRPVSIDARPNMFYSATNGNANASAPAVDRIPNSGIQTFNSTNTYALQGWSYELSHAWDIVYLRYAMTGDYYLFEELLFQPAMNLAARSPGTCNYCRGNTWGWSFDENRGSAWAVKFLSRAALLTPSGSPESLYFNEKLMNNLAVREGYFGMTNGAFYEPQSTSRWYWAQNTVEGAVPNPLAMQTQSECFNDSDMDPTKQYSASQPWTLNFNGAVWSETADMGFAAARPLANWWLSKHLLHEVLDPAYNPYLTGLYYEPVMSGSFASCGGSPAVGTPFFQTWADMKNAFVPATQAYADFNYATVQAEWAYPLIALATASFLPNVRDGALSGQAGYAWMKAKVPNQNLTMLVPRLRIIPRSNASGVLACDLNGDGVVDNTDVQLSISNALGQASCATADLDGDGRCDVIDVQRVINAALGGSCRVGQ